MERISNHIKMKSQQQLVMSSTIAALDPTSQKVHQGIIFLCLLLLSASQYHDISKTYQLYSSKRLCGCIHRIVENVPIDVICSQVCNEEGFECRSFNYIKDTKTCELNNCMHGELNGGPSQGVTWQDSADSTYYYVTDLDGACKFGEGSQKSSCHPYGTESCQPAAADVHGHYVPRRCNCYSFASGDDCSVIASACSEENLCFEYQSTVADHFGAAAACQSRNGYLATADSLEEQYHIQLYLQQYYGSADVHLGIRFYANYDDFAYTNNMHPVTGFTNWLEDKAANGRSECVKLDSREDYKWVDIDCSTQLPYICQVPACPSGFDQFNGSCYYLDTSVRTFDRNVDACENRDSQSGWTSYKEEEVYVTGTIQSRLGTDYAVSGGLQNYYEFQTFKWLHNNWTPLDFNNKWTYLGCYRNDSQTMLELEGQGLLVTDDYKDRSDAILKCFYMARSSNYKIFALQDDGKCLGDLDDDDYFIGGSSNNCSDGKGGYQAIDVYLIHNHNIYLNFAFDTGEWNQGQQVFAWWQSDNWRWHGYDQSGNVRTMCKIQICPQGYVHYHNKCFKINRKQLSRDDARDECQRSSGGDLFNPEYSDELTFLKIQVTNAGISGGLFWVGIDDKNLNWSRKYLATKNSVDSNFNVYLLGSEPIWRGYLDGAPRVTNVEMRYTFPSNGTVVGWEYYSGTGGRPAKFSVLRVQGTPTAGNCHFTVVGINSYTSLPSDYHRIDVPESDRIKVQRGDYTAMTFNASSNIRYSSEPGGVNFCGSTSNQPTSVGSTLSLYENWGGRIYSFRALWIPDEVLSSTLYDHGSPNVFDGNQCFVADPVANMKVRDAECNGPRMSICEIKKQHRFSPYR